MRVIPRLIFAFVIAIPLVVAYAMLVYRYLENTLLVVRGGSIKKRAQDFVRRYFLYFFLVIVLSFAGVGTPTFSNLEMYSEVVEEELTVRDIAFPSPYARALASSLEFPWAQGIFLGSILGAVFLICISRILAALYHPFMVRSILFYSSLALGVLIVAAVVNPLFIQVLTDVVFRKVSPYGMLMLFVAPLAAGLVSETWIYLFPQPWGARTGDVAFPGIYICKKCFATHRQETKGELPRCPVCSSDTIFSRER